MELSKNYMPSETEDKWYRHWVDRRYFNSRPDERPPFTVVIPPPNVTGVLHMGHTLNETVQDILIRKARMSGYNACWVPGSDHASIATEAKVVAMLKERGIEKNQLSRPEFMKYAFEWKDKYGGIIYHQIRKLGCSVDWDRVSFTMDADYYAAVIKVFVDLFQKGLIYRGARMIHWDPQARTALSDEEVIYKEEQGTLYYVAYKIVNADGSDFHASLPTEGSATESVMPALSGHIVIATQRPETIMGDTAVCVNPNDERYRALAGKFAIVPLVNRKVPFIFDEYVDPTFGTGALKVTPAHDINDYNLGLKHGLPIIDTLNEDGTLSAAADVFVGLDRFAARKKVVARLRSEGRLLKEEGYMTRLGYSERTNAVVEPRISTQWFVKMKEIGEPALTAVSEGQIHLHPGDRFMATYKYWLENVKDWCISRQLWWGQQIPAWYDSEGRFAVAENEAAARKLFTEQYGVVPGKLTQDQDVLDTWFSSWLWPIEVFKGITNPGNPEINYYYPTNVLVTAPEIIFFWVARMIMAGFEYMGAKPFSEVYFTGIVRDKQGRKMSKSLGNSPDLLELIDKYGADAVRFGIMIASPAGNDILFDEGALEQGRNFNNKLWNALKLVKMVWKVADSEFELKKFIHVGELPNETRWIPQPDHCIFAVDWFRSKLDFAKIEIDKLYKEFRLSEALKLIYGLVWDDFCSWYLEWIKPEYGKPIDSETHESTIAFFESLTQILHPFMPFITEEVYHLLRDHHDDLCIKQFGSSENPDMVRIRDGEHLKEVITAIRDFRAKNNLKNKDAIQVHIESDNSGIYFGDFLSILQKQLVIATIQLTNAKPNNCSTIVIGKDKFHIISETINVDADSLKQELLKELGYIKGFLTSVEKKLNNERFVQNAKPEIIALEQRKKDDAEAKIKALEESLAAL